MLPRTLEPEVMDTAEEAADYDAMDHSEVNRRFVDDFLAVIDASPLDERLRGQGEPVRILDSGTGTALIPIELCRRDVSCHVTAIDLAEEMLRVGERNVAEAALSDRITLAKQDGKALSYADGSFDAVMSNSIVHHVAEPLSVFGEMHRVLAPGGLLFVRDLLRPEDEATVEQLVREYAGDETPRQQQLFRQSLHAALTVAEVRDVLSERGLDPEAARQTTDRHWTVSAVKG